MFDATEDGTPWNKIIVLFSDGNPQDPQAGGADTYRVNP